MVPLAYCPKQDLPSHNCAFHSGTPWASYPTGLDFAFIAADRQALSLQGCQFCILHCAFHSGTPWASYPTGLDFAFIAADRQTLSLRVVNFAFCILHFAFNSKLQGAILNYFPTQNLEKIVLTISSLAPLASIISRLASAFSSEKRTISGV